MKKHPNTLTAFFGAMYAGCYYVPLDDEMPRHRIELIFQTLGAGALICDETTEDLAKELNYQGQVYRYDDLVMGEADDCVLSDIRHRQLDIDPIYIVFTSGSTGIPKGVVACHRSVIDYVEHLCDVLKFDENSVFGNQTPLLYDIDHEAAQANEIIGNRFNSAIGAKSNWRYFASPSLSEALADADFVVISILPATFDEMESDVHTPERYGIYQSVGDTVGPGGIIRALRLLPMIEEIAKAIETDCPDAWVINYTNPMTATVRIRNF